jgi:hypothetical protein
VVIGAIAAERSEFAPPSVQRRLRFLHRPGAVDRLLARAVAVAALGLVAAPFALALWSRDRASIEWLALVGLAQAAIVLGATAAFAVLAAPFAADSLWSARPAAPAVESEQDRRAA